MKKTKFIPGLTYIPTSGKVYDNKEIKNIIAAAHDGWWTEGRFAKQFENEFKKVLEMNYISLVNSGSSANLLAVACLTAVVFGQKRLKPGDEFITTPAAFPTTVNPGIIYGLKPVFVDVDLNTLNINTTLLEKAITKKTKLIMVAHTLGNPLALKKIVGIAKKYGLWFIEDCADALGSKYKGQVVGTFGDIATFSFYPAHQITMGEGGAVVTNNSLIYKVIRQFRDWGRDCWCGTGEDNACKKRFQWQIGDLPRGYDHKYIYSQIGYNLKLTDFQAAIGLAQLKKLPRFIKKRKENFQQLYSFFKKYSDHFLLITQNQEDDPCWFGFPLIVKRKAPFTRNQLAGYLENCKIGSRNLFAGNLLKHPAYKEINYRTLGKMVNCNNIMANALWLGVYPGIDKLRLNYIMKTVAEFVRLNQK